MRSSVRDMESGGGNGDFWRLPEECVSYAIGLTSPRDACRSEMVSSSLRAVAASDAVWEKFLPSDYLDILSRAVDAISFTSKKHLYFLLCDSIFIDGGKKRFALDRETGAKCFMLSARELLIVWGDTPAHWSWTHLPGLSRLQEVAKLLDVCWLEICGKIDSRMLSKKTKYAAYLIFKISDDGSIGLDYPSHVSVKMGDHEVNLSTHLDHYHNIRARRSIGLRSRFRYNRFARVYQQPMLLEAGQWTRHEPSVVDEPQQAQEHVAQENKFSQARKRHDGWMEVFMGEFYINEGDEGEVSMSLMETKGGHWKSGLIVQGIEIRPKK
ncbi:hypothetical protein HPP92_008774 [Vanilla planifolia]|uniref:F-box domain-containing protein n=1 Tax=Vanilla planifolia TaxID=51239 RepID=A0A835PEJ1_VANPL|nr:hypothetical protein HPP92_026867 [Vanilla planifolia]KAG0484888.1 hypothetical protein HPP92_008967 [Vanilla planifolia]KAG0486679.1 hypothetical protein HPP92_008774 [Vanilla planifolia]